MNQNRQYVRSMQGHARLIASFSPQAKMALLEELETPAAMNGDFDAAIDRLRAVIWDDAKAALIWSAAIAAIGSDLEAMRQKGQLRQSMTEDEEEDEDDDWDEDDDEDDEEEDWDEDDDEDEDEAWDDEDE